MFQNGGLGLAAPQVGLNYRMFLMGDPESAVACFNPSIVDMSPETTYDVEGCLSFPDQTVNVLRPNKIVVKYEDVDKKLHKMKLEGLASRVFQHEHDHMEGIDFTQRDQHK